MQLSLHCLGCLSLYFKKKHWNRLRENSKIRHFVISSQLFYWHANHTIHENSKLKPGENMLFTEIASDIQNNFSTQHVLTMFCKKKIFWQRLTFVFAKDGSWNQTSKVVVIILSQSCKKPDKQRFMFSRIRLTFRLE